MGSDWRAKFEGRTKEGFLKRFAVGGVIGGAPIRIVEEQGLILPGVVDVFGGKNPAIACAFSALVFFLFEDDPKNVAAPGIGVEIEVVTEDLCKAKSDFRGFARGFDGIEERVSELAGNYSGFRVRGDRLYFRGEALSLRDDVQNALGVNLVVD